MRPPAPAWPTLHPEFAQPLSPPKSSPKAPPTLPPLARGSSHPPWDCSLLLPNSRPPLFLSPSCSLWKAPGTRTTAGRPPAGLAGVRPGRGSWRRKETGGGGLSLSCCLPDRSLTQRSVPSAARRKSGQLERLLGTRRGRTGLPSASSCHKHSRDLSHAHSMQSPKWGRRACRRAGEAF